MQHRNEQATLFELTTDEVLDWPPGLPRDGAAPGPSPESDPSTSEGDVSPTKPRGVRAVSPLACMSLREVCAACGREITGGGLVISRDPVGMGLDYEDLGAFCDQRCSDKRFRSYLYEPPDEASL
jgi:hypothetical protein